MKFTITPTGVNGAVTLSGFHTNYLVRWENRNLLIDAGTLIGRSLHHLGVRPESIDGVYASHLHLDHVGGLYEIAYFRYVHGRGPLPVYLHSALAEPIWNNFLSGLATNFRDLQGRPQIGDRSTFFDFRPIDTTFESPTPGVVIDGLSLRLVQVDHIPNSPCHGVVLDDRVFVTTDTRFIPETLDRVANTFGIETIFHDCMFSEHAKIYHTAYEEILSLPKDLRDLIIMTHYEDVLPLAKEEIEVRLGEAGVDYQF
ncbi:MAG: MBL fold metallo-hydrolase [Deltaproteobacteria bacterium]|nr:MBL fold metallo-hydrolase [Deltaproteobacteria bacterium]